MAKNQPPNPYLAAGGFNESTSSSSDSSIGRPSAASRPATQEAMNLEQMRKKLLERIASGAIGDRSQDRSHGRSPLMDLTANRKSIGDTVELGAPTRDFGDSRSRMSESEHSLSSINVTHHESRMGGVTQSRVSGRDDENSADIQTQSKRDDQPSSKAVRKSPRRQQAKQPSKEVEEAKLSSTQRSGFDPINFSTPFVQPVERRTTLGGRDETFEDIPDSPAKRPGPKSRTMPPQSGKEPKAKNRSAPLEHFEKEEETKNQQREEEQEENRSEIEKSRPSPRTSPVSAARTTRPKPGATLKPQLPGSKGQSSKQSSKTKPGPSSKKAKQKLIAPVFETDEPSVFADSEEELGETEGISIAGPSSAPARSPAKKATLLQDENGTTGQEEKRSRSLPFRRASQNPKDSSITTPSSQVKQWTPAQRATSSTQGESSRATHVRTKSSVLNQTYSQTAQNARRKQPAPKKTESQKVTRMIRNLQEVRRLQATPELLIPKLPFTRVVREVTQEIVGPLAGFRYTTEAIEALQTIAEFYLTSLFTDAARVAAHANRVTVMPKDLELLRMLGLTER